MGQAVNTIIAGVISTLVMTGFLYFVHFTKMANGDMLRALGSYVTKRYENSFVPGLIIHIAAGIFFAFIYVGVWHYIGFTEPHELIMAGAMLGFAHGIAVSIMMIIFVAEHHPLPQFRQVGFAVAVTHVFAHVIYGAMVGFLTGYLSSLS